MKLKSMMVVVLVLLLAGCSYAPGYTGTVFWEMPEKVPDLPLPEYHISIFEFAGEKKREPIPDPKMDLDKLPDREDADIVRVRDYIPDLVVDLRYSGKNNFTGQVIYEFDELYLRYGTVMKLMTVQKELRAQGLRLKVWDGFRPVSAQYDLWQVCPNPEYVADPNTGFSDHSRGGTLDVTLVDVMGYELEMPSAFDDFTGKADRDFSDCSPTAAQNAMLLQAVMEKNGFTGYQQEWWHFADDVDYEVEDLIDPAVFATWRAECNEFINVRVAPDVKAEAIGSIPADGRFTLMGWAGSFAYVDFNGLRGFVNADYIRKV